MKPLAVILYAPEVQFTVNTLLMEVFFLYLFQSVQFSWLMLPADQDACGSEDNSTLCPVRIAGQGFTTLIAHPKLALWL